MRRDKNVLIVSSNSFHYNANLSALPLIELDTKVRGLDVPDGEVPAALFTIIIEPLEQVLSESPTPEVLSDQTFRPSWSDARPCVVAGDESFVILNGPRVREDGSFSVKLIQKCKSAERIGILLQHEISEKKEHWNSQG